MVSNEKITIINLYLDYVEPFYSSGAWRADEL
jgi:hypothetical protein